MSSATTGCGDLPPPPSQYSSLAAELASRTPRQINEFYLMFYLQINQMFWCLRLIYTRRD